MIPFCPMPDQVEHHWKRVICAGDCAPCPDCAEPVCPECHAHYADCACPGPTQDDQYEYRFDLAGNMWAKALNGEPE